MLSFKSIAICLGIGLSIGVCIWLGGLVIEGFLLVNKTLVTGSVPVSIQGPVQTTSITPGPAPGPAPPIPGPTPPSPAPVPVNPTPSPVAGLGTMCVVLIYDKTRQASYTTGQQALITQGESIANQIQPFNAEYRGSDVSEAVVQTPAWQAKISQAGGVPCVVILDEGNSYKAVWSGSAPDGTDALVQVVKGLRG